MKFSPRKTCMKVHVGFVKSWSSYCHLLILVEHNLHPLLLANPAHEQVH
jgi:hypothetical protein